MNCTRCGSYNSVRGGLCNRCRRDYETIDAPDTYEIAQEDEDVVEEGFDLGGEAGWE